MLAILVVVVIVGMVFVGCKAVSTAETTAAAETTAGTVDMKKYAGTEITVLGHPTHHVEGVVQFVDKFTELTGIKVNVELYEEATQREKQVLDYTSGRGDYDAAFVPFMFMVEYMQAGYLEPLDSYIANSPVMFDKPFELKDYPLWVTIPFRPGFDPANPLYAIGQCAYIPQVTYRADYMEQVGIDKVPTTVDEYNAYLAAYDKAMKDGTLDVKDFYPAAVRASSSFESYYSLAGITNAFGDPTLVDLTTKTPFPDKQAWIDGLTWISGVIQKYGHPGQATMTWYDLVPFMQAGQIGSWLDHSGYHGVWQLAKESTIPNATTYGPPLLGPSGRRMSTCPYTDGFAMNVNSKNKEATWMFIAWSVSNMRYQLELEKNIRFDLPNFVTINSDLYKSKIAENNLQNWYDMWTSPELGGLLLDDTDQIINSFKHYPQDVNFLELVEAYQVEASECIAGRQTAEEAVEKAAAKITEIMNR
ncbi:MAG: extracellular solute-binding protein [Actinobacteria bacterium]|nr:extracellular solute-binding protein [Actinomycetota bacterium]